MENASGAKVYKPKQKFGSQPQFSDSRNPDFNSYAVEPVNPDGTQSSSGTMSSGKWKWYAGGAVLAVAVIMFLRSKSSASSAPVTTPATGASPIDTGSQTSLQGINDLLGQLLTQTQAGSNQSTPPTPPDSGSGGTPVGTYGATPFDTEDKINRVNALYQKYYGRSATSAELFGDGTANNMGWVNVFGDQTKWNQIEGYIIGSAPKGAGVPYMPQPVASHTPATTVATSNTSPPPPTNQPAKL